MKLSPSTVPELAPLIVHVVVACGPLSVASGPLASICEVFSNVIELRPSPVIEPVPSPFIIQFSSVADPRTVNDGPLNVIGAVIEPPGHVHLSDDPVASISLTDEIG